MLRENGKEVILDNSKLKKAMKLALESNARYVIFIGDEEKLQCGAKIKDLDKSSETFSTFKDIINNIR